MTIDGQDILVYGGVLLDDSYKELVEFPKLKKPNKNDWAEYDSIEVDLEMPMLDKKSVVLNIGCDFDKVDNFTSYLKAKTYRTWDFPELLYKFNLRLEGFSSVYYLSNKAGIKVHLSFDDYIFNGYVYEEPNYTASVDEIVMDSKNLSLYGIDVLDGTKDSFLDKPKTKKILEVENSIMHGVSVSETPMKYKDRDIRIECLLKQPASSFWKAYKSFFYDLTLPNLRTFTAYGKTLNAFYKQSKVKDFHLVNGLVWCEFNVTITT